VRVLECKLQVEERSGSVVMKIEVYLCNMCQKKIPCILPKNVGGTIKEPYKIKPWNWEEEICSCPYVEAMAADFKLTEIEATELIKYFANPCENYFLTPMCDARGGICPKECYGNIEVCMQNVGVQRSIRK